MSEESKPKTLADMSDEAFIAGYIVPHILKNRDEGYHTRAIVLEEAQRRLEEYITLKNILRSATE